MVVSHGCQSWKRSGTSSVQQNPTKMLYYEATENWYAQRDLDEVEREEHN